MKKIMLLCAALHAERAGRFAFLYLYPSSVPKFSLAQSMSEVMEGMRDCPLSVSVYSTRGGTSG